MKKILFGTLAATFMLASCSQEEIYSPATGDEATVTIALGMPQIGSRAYSDGTSATHLQYAVYDVTSGTPTILDTYTVTDDQINISKQINFKLANGHKYRFVFWASAPEADGAYAVTFGENAATFKINTTSEYADFFKANLEHLDAFYVCEDLNVTGDIQKTFELRRPFAQINVGTNDYDEAAAVGYEPDFSYLEVTNAYTTLDLMTGEVDEAVTMKYNWNVINKEETFPVDGHDYMAMAYVLVGADEAEVTTVKFAYKQYGKDAQENVRNFGSVPVQRNYRTNIFGSILTSSVDVNVVIEPDYFQEDKTYDDLLFFLANGGTFNFTEDIEAKEDLMLRRDGVINLNGYTYKTTNGEMVVAPTSGNTANITINGEGTIAKTGVDAYNSTAAIYLSTAGSTVTVNGATVTTDGYEAIYVQKGTLYITGGYFAAAASHNGVYYTLNCNDTNFKNGTAKIIVSGGVFENFDPSNTAADKVNNLNANLLAPGYMSVETVIDGKTCYVVVPAESAAATADVVLATAAQLKDFASKVNSGEKFKGQVVALAGNIDLKGEEWTPIASGSTLFEGTFDGCGFTVSNITVNTTEGASAGFFATSQSATIKNLTLKNVDINGTFKTGGIAGDGLCGYIENCTVDGGTITSVPRLVNGAYDDANNVGGIVGYLSAEPNAWVKNCTVKNVTITAYRDLGGIVGTVGGANANVSGNKVINTNVIADQTSEYGSEKPANAGEIYGRLANNAGANVLNNTATGVTVKTLK